MQGARAEAADVQLLLDAASNSSMHAAYAKVACAHHQKQPCSTSQQDRVEPPTSVASVSSSIASESCRSVSAGAVTGSWLRCALPGLSTECRRTAPSRPAVRQCSPVALKLTLLMPPAATGAGLQCTPAQRSKAQHDAAQHSIVQHIRAQCSTDSTTKHSHTF